jgi:hypothetical protein
MNSNRWRQGRAGGVVIVSFCFRHEKKGALDFRAPFLFQEISRAKALF